MLKQEEKLVGSPVEILEANTLPDTNIDAIFEPQSAFDAGTFYTPEVPLQIERVEVIAKPRVLKARYSMELAQDLEAIHGIDVEEELAAILAQEIRKEIDN